MTSFVWKIMQVNCSTKICKTRNSLWAESKHIPGFLLDAQILGLERHCLKEKKRK
jgi:hypothetical protein